MQTISFRRHSRLAAFVVAASLAVFAMVAVFAANRAGASQEDGSVEEALAQVTEAIGGYTSTGSARAAGWDLQPGLDHCFENSGVGGMGFHYINPDLLDSTFELLKPEAIVYEPLADGQLRLAAVEYIIPAEAWDAVNTSPPEAPELGQHLHLNEPLGVYVLHAWVFKDNPAGIFEDWNPDVSCTSVQDGGDGGTDVEGQLDSVRGAIGGFTTTEAVQAAGWDLQPGLDYCFENPGVGAMGFHYINPDLLDTTFEPLAPEAIIYEPVAGGDMTLVAVEYIIPAEPWDATNTSPPEAPELGQHFHLNEELGVYVLHAWIFKDNPAGIFQDWNPDVSCPDAPEPPETGTGLRTTS